MLALAGMMAAFAVPTCEAYRFCFEGRVMMRILTLAMMSAALATGAAGPADAAASGTIVLQATATFSDGTTADRLYAVVSAADLDGDGVMDQGWLRVACKQGAMSAVYYAAASPRDSASGMATGKRQHGTVTITKEWGASTLSFGKTGGGGGGGGGAVGSTVNWDLVKGKGARVAAGGGSGARATWDLGKGKGDRVAAGGGSGGSGGKTMAVDSWQSGMTLVGKTMGHDDWHEVAMSAGSPNLCD